MESTYAALASVASITTALHAAVAMQTLNIRGNIKNRKSGQTPGTQGYNDVVNESKRVRWVWLTLNVLTILINGAVITAWGDIALSIQGAKNWVFIVPWTAVTFAAVTLVVCGLVGIKGIFGEAK